MAQQLALLGRADADDLFYLGPVERSGVARYVHLVRDVNDPRETVMRGAEARASGQRKPGHEKRLGTVDESRARILAHLADGVPRTFNRICVELYGLTADVVFEHEPDEALWQLVEREEVALTHAAPIRFVHAKALVR